MIDDEMMNEIRLNFRQKDEFEAMFDGLQEGIIVVDQFFKIDFMNALSNKIMSTLIGVTDFLKERKKQSTSRLNSSLEKGFMEKKLFFVRQNANADKSKKSASSDEG